MNYLQGKRVKGFLYINIPLPIPLANGLQIEKSVFDTVLRPPNSIIRNSFFNPSACFAQYYNIVEDLSQAPCAISTLEVLQTCLTQ